MSIVFDLIILTVIALCILSGWKNGFVKSLMEFASSILAFFAALFFTPYLGAYICENYLLGAIASEIAETLTSLLNMAGGTTEKLFTSMPLELSNIFDRFGVDQTSFVAKFSSSKPVGEELVNDMAETIAMPAAQMISAALAFIIIFVAVAIILKIVTIVIGLAVELPVLKQLNEVFGLVFGVFTALFYSIVLATVFSHLAESLAVFDPSRFSADMIENTFLTKMFSELRISMLLDMLREGVGKLV